MGKKIPAILAKVHGRASKREGFDGFFRAGVKWPDDPKGVDREFAIIERATEAALSDDERKGIAPLLAVGKVVREAHFQGLLADPMVMAVVKSAKAIEVELPEPEATSLPASKPLLERLTEILAEEPAPKPSTKR